MNPLAATYRAADLLAVALLASARALGCDPQKPNERVLRIAADVAALSAGMDRERVLEIFGVAPPPKAPAPPPVRRAAGRVERSQAEDEDRLLRALFKLAGGAPEVQASITRLAEASGIPAGSIVFVSRRLAETGSVTVRKSLKPGTRQPAPNTYVLPPRPPQPQPQPQPRHSAPSTAPLATRHDIKEMTAIAMRDAAPMPKGATAAVQAKGREDPELPRAELPRSYRKPARPARKVADHTAPATPAAATPPALRIPVEFDEPDLAPAGPDGSLLALRSGQCKWPINTWPAGQGHLARFCCKPRAGEGPYCASHGGASA